MLVGQAQAMYLLKKYGISYPETLVLSDGDTGKAKKWKFPAVLKVDAPGIIHKSDSGLVFSGLKSLSEVKRKAVDAARILKRKGIKEYRLVLQEQVSGVELIVGMKRDSTFGPVIIFGAGGVFAEVINDVSMRIAPVTEEDCMEMIGEIRGKKMLDGYRNFAAVDKKQLISLLMKVSRLSLNEKEISELDFNPVIANGKNLLVVDARILKNA